MSRSRFKGIRGRRRPPRPVEEKPEKKTSTPRRKSGVPSELALVLFLFASSRLMLLLAYPAESLAAYGDYRFYFDLASLSERGLLPFLSYWSEHAPLFPFLSVGLYHLAGDFADYTLLTGLMLLGAECLALGLTATLARTIHGESQAVRIAWAYAVLFIPTFIWLSTFEALTALFILAALLAVGHSRPALAGAAVGLGVLTKYIPLCLLATVWRAHGWRGAAVAALVCLIIVGGVLAPLYAASPAYTAASLLATASKSSWQTVWALFDGNLQTGALGPIADRFDPLAALQPLHNPPKLPGWLTFIPFGLIGLYALRLPRAAQPADAVRFSTLTFTLFFLWSKGWSPQWQMFLIPLLLLSFPLRRALLYIVTLGFVNLLEWPVLLSRGLNQLLPLTIASRTLILVLIAVELIQQMRAAAKASRPSVDR